MSELEKVEAEYREYRENSIEQDKAYQACIDRQGAIIGAIRANLTHMVGILKMDMIHANTMIKIEYAQELLEILGEKEGPETDLERFYRIIYEFIDPDNKPALLLPDTVIQIIGKWKGDAESWVKMLAVMGPFGAKVFVEALEETFAKVEAEGTLIEP